MKITVDRDVLLNCLSHIQSVVERRNTIPILANVLLTAEKNQITFTATDMDLEIRETAAGKVSDGGKITVAAHMLFDIVKKLGDGSSIQLEKPDNSNQIILTSGRSHFKLGTLPVDDFPLMRETDLEHTFTIPGATLKSLIDRTRFAISTEENRYYLNGIFIHATTSANDNGKGRAVLRAVATDGHRLARVEIPAPKGAESIPGVIIPRKTVLELHKLLDAADSDVTIQLSATKIRAKVGNVTVTSKLIDGTYPDYERVIPAANDKFLEVNARQFASAVDRVATISTEKSRAVKMAVANGQLSLTASSPDAGSASEEIEVNYTQPNIEIGFNARYLLDITQQISGDAARFALADSGSPTLVQDTADPSAVYVLMPMRV